MKTSAPARVCLYSKHNVLEPIRITGAYKPPSAGATRAKMRAMTAQGNQSHMPRGEAISHLIVCDLNQHSWHGGNDVLFHEWHGEAGRWELNDPTKPTHTKGSTLDKFLLLPGTNIPDEWLPPINCIIVDLEDGGGMYPKMDL